MEREEILKELKSIIGRSFQFSDAFIKKCPVYIGVGERPYCRLTQKYLYVSCFKIFSYREDVDEYGVEIKKFPICYNSLYGEFVDKVPLDKLFTSDLNKILADIKYALWWETNVHLPKIQSELEDAKKYEALFKKLE